MHSQYESDCERQGHKLPTVRRVTMNRFFLPFITTSASKCKSYRTLGPCNNTGSFPPTVRFGSYFNFSSTTLSNLKSDGLLSHPNRRPDRPMFACRVLIDAPEARPTPRTY